MGYMPAEYEKNNQFLCSEGERRMLAFAYFMQEIQNDPNEKIVVIDDPISSLDLSRKSVVAYKIIQLIKTFPINSISPFVRRLGTKYTLFS